MRRLCPLAFYCTRTHTAMSPNSMSEAHLFVVLIIKCNLFCSMHIYPYLAMVVGAVFSVSVTFVFLCFVYMDLPEARTTRSELCTQKISESRKIESLGIAQAKMNKFMVLFANSLIPSCARSLSLWHFILVFL